MRKEVKANASLDRFHFVELVPTVAVSKVLNGLR
jgi:hypothetical protein